MFMVALFVTAQMSINTRMGKLTGIFIFNGILYSFENEQTIVISNSMDIMLSKRSQF